MFRIFSALHRKNLDKELTPTRGKNLLNNQFTLNTIQLNSLIVSCSRAGKYCVIFDSDNMISLFDLLTQALLWSHKITLSTSSRFGGLEILPSGHVVYTIDSGDVTDDYKRKIYIHTLYQGKEIGAFTTAGFCSDVDASINLLDNSVLIRVGAKLRFNHLGGAIQPVHSDLDLDARSEGSDVDEDEELTKQLRPGVRFRGGLLGKYKDLEIYLQAQSKYTDGRYDSDGEDVEKISICTYNPHSKKFSQYSLDCEYKKFNYGLREFGALLFTYTHMVAPVLNNEENYLFHCISIEDHTIQVIKAPKTFVSDGPKRIEIDGNVLTIVFYSFYHDANPNRDLIHKWTVDVSTGVQREDVLGMKDVQNLTLEDGIVVGTFNKDNKSFIEIRNYNAVSPEIKPDLNPVPESSSPRLV